MLIEEHISGSVTFRNGETASLSDSNVISASVRQQCCPDGSFTIGGVYAAQLSIVCRISGTNSFNLRGAKIVLASQFGHNASIPRGTFWIINAPKQSGDIYSITAQDAVGWLDSSSFSLSSGGTVFDNIAKYFEAQGAGYTINGWCSMLTSFTNSLIARFTGESGVLSWSSYNESANGVYTNHYAFPAFGGGELYFFLSTEAGSGQSDCPRDLFRYLAYLSGGFVYAKNDGSLSLGQFGMPEFSTAEITESCIETDSCEIADYQLQLIVASAQSGIANHAYDAASSTTIPDYMSLSPFRIQADSNPFLDGFAAAYIRGDGSQLYSSLNVIVEGLYYFNHHFQTAGNWETGFKGISALRPFRCKVHKAEAFHLGQKIQIFPPEGSAPLESTITSVIWNFRGGCTLACAGEDSRTMADSLRMSMAEKSIRETRSRFQTLEQQISNLS
ncbi:MAG: hypothetical protein IJJ69_04040 [Oscillospiraceae bacterium]|nr:hypothetical protein [Oscillospiraceae bacterium]